MTMPEVNLSFPHAWRAEILAARPMILPPRHYVYPREVEEIERGALEIDVRTAADAVQPFLATCALGFRDPIAPTGIWSAPNPHEMCAVSGGYAYIIDTTLPEHFTMIPYRPVLAGAARGRFRIAALRRESHDSRVGPRRAGMGIAEALR